MSKTNNTPRRVQSEFQIPAEKAIRKAIAAVEKLPADERLTEAVMLLSEALQKVGDYVDKK